MNAGRYSRNGLFVQVQSRFRPGPQVHARTFDGEMVVIDLGHGKYFSLDEVGAVMWEKLTGGLSVGEVATAIRDDFDVDEATAGRDVQRLAEQLVAAGLLEPRD